MISALEVGVEYVAERMSLLFLIVAAATSVVLLWKHFRPSQSRYYLKDESAARRLRSGPTFLNLLHLVGSPFYLLIPFATLFGLPPADFPSQSVWLGFFFYTLPIQLSILPSLLCLVSFVFLGLYIANKVSYRSALVTASLPAPVAIVVWELIEFILKTVLFRYFI